MIYKTFNGTGADCSGGSGDANRVLTLSNTSLTSQAGFLVYASGLALGLDIEYTVSHASSGTTVTFLNRLWDDMTIVVQYSEDVATEEYQDRRTDFQSIVSEHGITATLTRETKTVDGMGGVTAISETNYNIVLIIQDITKKDRQIHEMGLAIPGNSKAFFYHTYPNSITGNGSLTVQVGDYITVDSKKWRIEQLNERYILGYEIFKAGIIHNIDLS